MSKHTHDSDRDDDGQIQVEYYGIKRKFRPVASDERQPKTWQEVRDRMNRSLMRIATEPLALVADVFSGARSLVRGICSVPTAIASRIRRARKQSDDREDETQAIAATETAAIAHTPEQALGELKAVLDRFQSMGLAVEVRQLSDGQAMIAVVRPELAGQVAGVAKRVEGEVRPALPKNLETEQTAGIESLGLPARATKALRDGGVINVPDPARHSKETLLVVHGIGPNYVQQIEAALAKTGYRLRDE